MCSRCFEKAAETTGQKERRRLLTFCIIGGGPTGVEYAGALAELVRLVLPHEYPEFPPSDVRVVLLEGGDRLCRCSSVALSRYTRRELEGLGVEVHTDTLVASAGERGVVTKDGTEIVTASIIWTAGVQPAWCRTIPA